ncbi:MAG: FAD-dependent oxidoreductase, partial [Planctomycetales bacterium]
MPLTMDRLPSRDVVLIGAGHTNLHVVRMWRMGAIPDARLTLVTPFARATYSGMLPGTLAGLYRPEEMEIDLYRFTASCGVRLIVAEAVGLDAKQHRVLVADRPPVRYDVASVGIGSVPARRDLWESCPRVLSIKPMATFCDRLERALSDARQLLTPPGDAGPPPVRVAVVGAGAGGTEVTFSLDAWLRSRGVPAQVTLVDSGEEVLPGYSAGAIQRVRREMARRGIALRLGDRVTQIVDAPGQPMQLQFARQSALAADFVIWGTTAAAPPALQNFQLPKSDDGFLTVRPTLQTTGPFPVFAVGDSACFVESPLPKAGVYAVREGPVLWDNLQRLLAGRELRPYVPQRGFLSLLATGDGRAVMQYRGWAGHGRWAWQWKDHIDRKFMRMYQDYSPPPQMPASIRAGNAPAGRADGHVGRGSGAMAPPMRCHGCGSKVGANILAEALGRLSISPDARTRLALDRPDDAA